MAASTEGIERFRLKLRVGDIPLSILLGIGLTWLVWSSARANLVTDAVDYYSILQKLVSPQAAPLVSNLHFVEQRSPGYASVPYRHGRSRWLPSFSFLMRRHWFWRFELRRRISPKPG